MLSKDRIASHIFLHISAIIALLIGIAIINIHAKPVSSQVSCPLMSQGDVNCSNTIDITDLSILLANFGTQTADPTATPTITPVPTGTVTWSRTVTVQNTSAQSISGALVQASGLSSSNCTTNWSGMCTVTVSARDTGSVTLTVTAPSYQQFQTTYPGLPTSGSVTITLQSLPTATPTPAQTLPTQLL